MCKVLGTFAINNCVHVVFLLERFVLRFVRVEDVTIIAMEKQVEARPQSRLAILTHVLHIFRLPLAFQPGKGIR